MRTTVQRRVLFGLAALTLVAASVYWLSQRVAASDSYFPLDDGRTWRFSLRYEGEDVPENETLDLSIDRQVSLGERKVSVRRDALGIEYYIAEDDSGIFRVAFKNDDDEMPTADATPRYVLKRPFGVGTEWSAVTVPYLMKRKNEFPRDLRYLHKTLMTYRIEAIEQTVEVPAGKYEHCLRVVGNATLRLYTDPVNGFSDVPLVTTEWYCRGTGLVKFERSEKLRSGFMTGGAVTAELVN